jgi:antitoxin VapB
MAISIRDGETDRLARELVRLTGETITEAIGIALRERLERVRAERDGGRVARLHAIADRCAAHMGGPANAADHGELLYDELGLPR